MKINWNSVGTTIVGIGKIFLCGAGICALAKLSGDNESIYDDEPVHAWTYSGAVGTIMDSDMFGHQKSEAVSMLKRNETGEYYRAIENIVDSDMFSHDKLKLIKQLSKC